jgi:two-component system phosphate regulon sensor histidine kinase PhoR
MKSKTKKIKLKLDKSYEKPIWVRADKQRIFQVISNLLVNSINYGKENGKTEITVKKGKKKVAIKVEDNGMGISENDLPRIFERFYRVDKSRSREQGGTGLGLAIVKHILEGHDESITARSEVGKGTFFEFTLPRVTHAK